MKHDQLQFYFTVASGGSHKALREAYGDSDVPEPESCMVSYATQHNKPWPGPEWFIDSGGYSTLQSNGSYDNSIEDYIRFVRVQEQRENIDIGRYALRDWASEPELLRENDRHVRDHQNFTIRDHVHCLELSEQHGVDADPVAVLQGYNIEEYLACIDYYREHGLLTDHVGVGSVCRRNQTEQIRTTLLRIRDELPSRCSIHAFGVKNDILNDPSVVSALGSVDTAAWESKAYYNAVANASTGENRYTWDKIQAAYIEYRAKIRDRLDSVPEADHMGVTSISDFGAVEIDQPPYPLVECRCGTLVDLNNPERRDATCRHCSRLLIDLWDRRLDPADDYAPEQSPFHIQSEHPAPVPK